MGKSGREWSVQPIWSPCGNPCTVVSCFIVFKHVIDFLLKKVTAFFGALLVYIEHLRPSSIVARRLEITTLSRVASATSTLANFSEFRPFMILRCAQMSFSAGHLKIIEDVFTHLRTLVI
jgi:hypothetical protein